MNSTELKEAIVEYIKSKELVLMGYSPEYIDDVKTDMEIAFRAGAEWMAEQEQPEVDLERELRDYFSKWDYDSYDGVITMNDDGVVATLSSIQNVARHFYELGLKARKEK